MCLQHGPLLGKPQASTVQLSKLYRHGDLTKIDKLQCESDCFSWIETLRQRAAHEGVT